MKINIAIDGPSGSGKSTLAKLLGKKYDCIYIDTGALYRTIGLYIQNKNIESTDTAAIIDALNEIKIEMKLINGGGAVILNGKPIGNEIRTPKSSIYASDVSKIPEVRQFLLSLQQDIAAKNSVIMDGRDIGTVVLPNADVKIFMTANEKERAKRRFEELKEKGDKSTLEQVLADMIKRDENDRNRAVSPALPAEDAILLDNTGFEIEQTLAAAGKIIDEKLKVLQSEI